jgi:hypothetical protein
LRGARMLAGGSLIWAMSPVQALVAPCDDPCEQQPDVRVVDAAVEVQVAGQAVGADVLQHAFEVLEGQGDLYRVIAAYWADGPGSDTPHGHWNVIARMVSLHPSISMRIGGAGERVDPTEWDAKLLLVVNATLHDAAIAAFRDLPP